MAGMGRDTHLRLGLAVALSLPMVAAQDVYAFRNLQLSNSMPRRLQAGQEGRDCQVGSFQSTAGDCEPCATGRYDNGTGTGSSTCASCPAGTWSDAGSSTCLTTLAHWLREWRGATTASIHEELGVITLQFQTLALPGSAGAGVAELYGNYSLAYRFDMQPTTAALAWDTSCSGDVLLEPQGSWAFFRHHYVNGGACRLDAAEQAGVVAVTGYMALFLVVESVRGVASRSVLETVVFPVEIRLAQQVLGSVSLANVTPVAAPSHPQQTTHTSHLQLAVSETPWAPFVFRGDVVQLQQDLTTMEAFPHSSRPFHTVWISTSLDPFNMTATRVDLTRALGTTTVTGASSWCSFTVPAEAEEGTILHVVGFISSRGNNTEFTHGSLLFPVIDRPSSDSHVMKGQLELLLASADEALRFATDGHAQRAVTTALQEVTGMLPGDGQVLVNLELPANSLNGRLRNARKLAAARTLRASYTLVVDEAKWIVVAERLQDAVIEDTTGALTTALEAKLGPGAYNVSVASWAPVTSLAPIGTTSSTTTRRVTTVEPATRVTSQAPSAPASSTSSTTTRRVTTVDPETRVTSQAPSDLPASRTTTTRGTSLAPIASSSSTFTTRVTSAGPPLRTTSSSGTTTRLVTSLAPSGTASSTTTKHVSSLAPVGVTSTTTTRETASSPNLPDTSEENGPAPVAIIIGSLGVLIFILFTVCLCYRRSRWCAASRPLRPPPVPVVPPTPPRLWPAPPIDSPPIPQPNPSPGPREEDLELVLDLAILGLIQKLFTPPDDTRKTLGYGQDMVPPKVPYNTLKVLYAWAINKPSEFDFYSCAKKVIRDTEENHSPVTTLTDEVGAAHGLESLVNEKLLMHGTQPDNVLKIFQRGLNEKFTKRVAFGQGIYFAEDPSKSDQYATVDQADAPHLKQLHERLYEDFGCTHPGEVHYTFVCQVILGTALRTQGRDKDSRCLLSIPDTHHSAPVNVFEDHDEKVLICVPGVDGAPGRHPYHSLIAEKGPGHVRHREFVIFEKPAVLLKYLVAYERKWE